MAVERRSSIISPLGSVQMNGSHQLHEYPGDMVRHARNVGALGNTAKTISSRNLVQTLHCPTYGITKCERHQKTGDARAVHYVGLTGT